MNFDPTMILWATLICVLLTGLRAVLSRVLFTVSLGREGGEREGGRGRHAE